MQRARATGVLDTSVNKVYVKLNWTKTAIKLNPLPGCFITHAACVWGGGAGGTGSGEGVTRV